MTRRGDLEECALKLIGDKGDEGILQRDMWRELGGTSREGSRISLRLEGSRISLRLEAKNLIKRERELSTGRWTHRLYSTIRPVNIDSLIDVPCFICEDIRKCDAGAEISASTCEKLTQWLIAS